MRATMDLIAAYNYDSTVLDLLEVPDELDRDTLIENLLMETAEREIIYTNLGFLKQAIGSWSKKNLGVWTELYKTTQYEYNPIWNKDGTIKETVTRDLATTEDTTTNVDRVDALEDLITRNLKDVNTRAYNDNETRNLEDKNTRAFTDTETRDLDSNSIDSVYGFNSSSDAPANKNVSEDNGTDTINHTGTDTFNHTGTDNIAHTGTDTYDHTGTDKTGHTGRQDLDTKLDKDTTDTGTITTERVEQGNIGVTSTQSLIQEQREVVKLNLMDIIIDDFQKKFCLGIY